MLVKNSVPQCQFLNHIGLFSQSKVNIQSVYINIYDVSCIDTCQDEKRENFKCKETILA